MTLTDLNCGYIPLVDSAPLIIAKELNFAADEGLRLNLVRQPSWSATRDMLALGHLEAAHMLAPLPVAMALGLGGLSGRIDTLMNISLNGNTFCVSTDLAQKMREMGWRGNIRTPIQTATYLLKALRRPLQIGIPFPLSMHRLLLDYWLTENINCHAASYRTQTVPPHRMADALARGQIDMFCVGEPWGSVAVQMGAGQMVLTGTSVWASAPEKVLAVRHDWTRDAPEICGALMRATYRACEWLDMPDNKVLAIEILSRTEHLALSEQAIDPAILRRLTPALGGDPVEVPNFLKFHTNAATFPWKSQAGWMANQLVPNPTADQRRLFETAKATSRTDLYRTYLGAIGVDLPGASEKIEGALANETAVASTKGEMILAPDAFFDGAVFDPDQ